MGGLASMTQFAQVVMLVLSAVAVAGHYAFVHRANRQTWVMIVQYCLLASAAGASAIVFVASDDITAHDLWRVYLVRPEVVVAQYVILFKTMDNGQAKTDQ